MSEDESFFDNVWEAADNLVDAAVDVTEGTGHLVVGLGHSAAAAANAVWGYDAEDRQDMVDHYDAGRDEGEAARESFGNAWDEIF